MQPDPRTPAHVIDDITEELGRFAHTTEILQALQAARHASVEFDVARTGAVLLDAGLLEEGHALYRAATRHCPLHPVGFVGLAQLAMRRENWPDARRRWNTVLRAFGQSVNAFWLSARALVLLELGAAVEAYAQIELVVERYPDQPAGPAALAQVALRRGAWSEVVDRCDELLGRFGAHPAALAWRLMKVRPLIELGRHDAAEGIAREARDARPALMAALLTLMQIQKNAGRPQAAWATFCASPLREIRHPALIAQRIELLVLLGRSAEARALFVDVRDRAQRPEPLESLFECAAQVYGGAERRAMLDSLLARCAQIRSLGSPADAVPFACLEARLALASHERRRVIAAIGAVKEHERLGRPGDELRRIAALFGDPRFPDLDKEKIFGIGLSRTGTTTLAAALRLLGFATLHWMNPLTREVIGDDDIPLFDAFLDTPVSVRFEHFDERWPNSKFIWTERPYEAWLASMRRLWRNQLGLEEFADIKAALARADASDAGRRLRDINDILYFDHDGFRAAFEAYERRVLAFFTGKRATRLLRIDVTAGEGWPRLCAFLGRDPPREPFPWSNRARPAD
jgi:tetratricopeptide (TPR) repeat protein